MTIKNNRNKMTGSIRRMFAILCAIILIPFCRERSKFKKEFYEDGKIKSEGFYISGKPIDTIRTYFKKGGINSIEVYNKKNMLSGRCMYYYSNGLLSEEVSYVDGKKTGRYVSYKSNGDLDKVGYFYEDKPMGDAYYFDNGYLSMYNFSDFNNKGLMLCKYDSSGNILEKDDFDFYFVDSVVSLKEGNVYDTIRLMFLVSHQPKTFMNLILENIDKKGNVVNTFELKAKDPVAFFDNIVTKDIDTVKIVATRYDSLLKKEKTFMIVQNVN